VVLNTVAVVCGRSLVLIMVWCTKLKQHCVWTVHSSYIFVFLPESTLQLVLHVARYCPTTTTENPSPTGGTSVVSSLAGSSWGISLTELCSLFPVLYHNFLPMCIYINMRSALIFTLILKGQILLHSKRNPYSYMDIAAFWDITSCSLIAIHIHFRGTC